MKYQRDSLEKRWDGIVCAKYDNELGMLDVFRQFPDLIDTFKDYPAKWIDPMLQDYWAHAIEYGEATTFFYHPFPVDRAYQLGESFLKLLDHHGVDALKSRLQKTIESWLIFSAASDSTSQESPIEYVKTQLDEFQKSSPKNLEFSNALEFLDSDETEMRKEPTCIPEIDADRMLQGGFAPDLSILFADPGCGKTAFALEIAFRRAREGRTTLYCTNELDMRAANNRLYAAALKAPIKDIKHFSKARILKGAGTWLRHAIVARIGTDLGKVKDKIRRMIENLPEDTLIVVDQVTKMDATGKFSSDAAKYSKIAYALSNFAVDIDRPLLGIAHSNREGQKSGGALKAYHVKGSAAWQEAARAMIAIYSPYESEDKVIKRRIKIAKSNYSPQFGEIEMDYITACASFAHSSEF